ncbi:MAG: hypothetical protein KatS3mg115_0757 [Candidatus Poribacteria bacterium]|nr:MAG: hypothetical protein KatS3mg115_0757 [Candidatus Poribacteria bacterium]
MDLLHEVRTWRKQLTDRVLGPWVPALSADDLTRLGTWACFLGAIAWLAGHRWMGVLGLAFSLLFDLLDGVQARREGQVKPHLDWAADRWAELTWVGPLLLSEPALWSWGYLALAAANVFLPRWGVSMLPLRHLLILYAVFVYG